AERLERDVVRGGRVVEVGVTERVERRGELLEPSGHSVALVDQRTVLNVVGLRRGDLERVPRDSSGEVHTQVDLGSRGGAVVRDGCGRKPPERNVAVGGVRLGNHVYQSSQAAMVRFTLTLPVDLKRAPRRIISLSPRRSTGLSVMTSYSD